MLTRFIASPASIDLHRAALDPVDAGRAAEQVRALDKYLAGLRQRDTRLATAEHDLAKLVRRRETELLETGVESLAALKEFPDRWQHVLDEIVASQLLQREGFEVIASQALMVRELPLKVRARMRVRIKDKRLVPQYG